MVLEFFIFPLLWSTFSLMFVSWIWMILPRIFGYCQFVFGNIPSVDILPWFQDIMPLLVLTNIITISLMIPLLLTPGYVPKCHIAYQPLCLNIFQDPFVSLLYHSHSSKLLPQAAFGIYDALFGKLADRPRKPMLSVCRPANNQLDVHVMMTMMMMMIQNYGVQSMSLALAHMRVQSISRERVCTHTHT